MSDKYLNANSLIMEQDKEGSDDSNNKNKMFSQNRPEEMNFANMIKQASRTDEVRLRPNSGVESGGETPGHRKRN